MAKPQDDEDLASLTHPSAAHIARSGEALSSIASTINAASSRSQKGTELNVVFHHADHQGFLNPLVYNFHFVPVDEQGQATNAFEEGLPARFISMLNVPVGIQIESALGALTTSLARRRHIAEWRASGATPDGLTTNVDDVALNRLVDVLRHGWTAAAEMIAREASDAGFSLHVSYMPTAEPAREGVVRRAGALRHAYNTVPVARDAVDRFVSALSTHLMVVGGPGVPEALRALAQQHMALGSIRFYLSQAVRDAFVTGNGYVLFSADSPISAYNAKPELAVDLGGDQLTSQPGEPVQHGLHLRGMQQPSSLYGLGMLEVLLPTLLKVETFQAAAQAARPMLSLPLQDSHRQWAQTTIARADQSLVDLDAQFRDILSPPFSFLVPPTADLYFPGRELM